MATTGNGSAAFAPTFNQSPSAAPLGGTSPSAELASLLNSGGPASGAGKRKTREQQEAQDLAAESAPPPSAAALETTAHRLLCSARSAVHYSSAARLVLRQPFLNRARAFSADSGRLTKRQAVLASTKPATDVPNDGGRSRRRVRSACSAAFTLPPACTGALRLKERDEAQLTSCVVAAGCRGGSGSLRAV